uniref:CHAT domain-containing protein n=1 Tax=Candidatus Desulfatibia profunda TaxID=2841695 RepID=A0A8J6NQA3_9BACT|nr:CHAT domain-containing protein [Candidatus Desulfatibia profunda]
MTAMRWLVVFLAVFISGCAGAGLSKSESMSHYNPLTLIATKSKGDILIQEGLDYSREGFFEKFMASMREALIFYSADGEKTSDIYGYIGNAYLEKNEYDKALDYFNRSLSAAKINGYNHGIVLATVGIANCYKKIGDTDKAIEVLAASPKKNPNTGSDYPLVALNMGENLAQKGDLSQALEIFNKLLSSINSDKDDKLKQSVYSSLGTTLFGLSRYEEAIANYQHALDLARKRYTTADVVDLLNNIGFCLVSLKKYDDATMVFKEGLGLLAVMDLYYPEKQMYANYGLGLLNEEQNRNTQALLYYNTAIRFIEDLRGNLSSTEFRSFFLANKIAAYEHAIDILLTVGSQILDDGRLNEMFHKAGLSPAELAFFYTESTKARSFLELLSKTKTGTLADRIPKELAEQEKKLLNTIASIQAAGGGQSKSQKELLKKSKRELDELIVKLRKDYPDYASIRYPEPVKAGNIPLRSNEVLLAYKVNPGKTYLWIIEKGKDTSAIEIDVSREELIQRVGEFRGFMENPDSLEAYDPEKGQTLGRLLLGEALSRIDPAKNIIITPDGVLNILPFEALIVGKTSNTVQYLGEKYKISYYPSASVMATMRRFKESPKSSNPLFALGDPVYDDSDLRYSLKKSGNIALAAADKTPGLNLRSALVRSGFSLPRLPETRDEVLRIGELFGYKTNDPNIKLDMDATKSELLKSNLGNYRFIHFATHGILSGDIPYILEPALVLTQPGNRNPEDGFLKMSEILELKLNADAVVLSACKTALGKEIAGEGVVGLSRAFMLAGSKSVIVSLWSVESNSTAVLMKSFYSHLKPGRSKEEALRLAKQELKNQSLISDDLSRGVKIVGRDKKTQTSTAHPFFWAPFILIGEWE